MQKITTKKPWGQFEEFTHNEKTTIKILTIEPNSSLSLQYHNKRDEFWRVLNGHLILTIGNKTTNANSGDEFMILKKEKHRIETKDEVSQVLEISFHDFDEEDIIRLNDKYGRS